MRYLLTSCIAGICALAAACSPGGKKDYVPEYSSAPPAEKVEFIFGVVPHYNPQHLYEEYTPLIDYLNNHLSGIKLELLASRSYEEFEKRLSARTFHFAFANPYQIIVSVDHGYRVFGKVGDDAHFRGLILVRKDSGINTVADLKGKTVSFAAPTAFAGTMLPLYFLHTQGLDVNRDIRRLYVGSQESSIMSVYLGKSAAGGTLPMRWQSFVADNPQIAADLLVKWETPPLSNDGFLVRNDVPKEVVDKVAALLFGLQTHEEGRRILRNLEITEFEEATNKTYEPVYDFLKKYRAVVH